MTSLHACWRICDQTSVIIADVPMCTPPPPPATKQKKGRGFGHQNFREVRPYHIRQNAFNTKPFHFLGLEVQSILWKIFYFMAAGHFTFILN